MNFQQQYLYWLAGSGAADCGGDVLPRSRQPAPHHHRAVLGLYGLVFLVGDWTYRLLGDVLGEGSNENACCISSLAGWWW